MKEIIIGSAIWLSGFSTTGYFILVDTGPTTFGEIVGEVVGKKGEIRSRPIELPLWTNVSTSQKLTDGTIVFSGKNSSAKILLANNQLLTLAPESQIVLLTPKLSSEGGTEGADLNISILSGKANIAQATQSTQLEKTSIKNVTLQRKSFGLASKPLYSASKKLSVVNKNRGVPSNGQTEVAEEVVFDFVSSETSEKLKKDLLTNTSAASVSKDILNIDKLDFKPTSKPVYVAELQKLAEVAEISLKEEQEKRALEVQLEKETQLALLLPTLEELPKPRIVVESKKLLFLSHGNLNGSLKVEIILPISKNSKVRKYFQENKFQLELEFLSEDPDDVLHSKIIPVRTSALNFLKKENKWSVSVSFEELKLLAGKLENIVLRATISESSSVKKFIWASDVVQVQQFDWLSQATEKNCATSAEFSVLPQPMLTFVGQNTSQQFSRITVKPEFSQLVWSTIYPINPVRNENCANDIESKVEPNSFANTSLLQQPFKLVFYNNQQQETANVETFLPLSQKPLIANIFHATKSSYVFSSPASSWFPPVWTTESDKVLLWLQEFQEKYGKSQKVLLHSSGGKFLISAADILSNKEFLRLIQSRYDFLTPESAEILKLEADSEVEE